MDENKVLKWIDRSWAVSIFLGLLLGGVYGLVFSRMIGHGISEMLIQSIGGLMLAALYFISGSILHKRKSISAAVVLFVITVLDTCYRIYLGSTEGTVIFLICIFVFFKGINAALYLRNEMGFMD